MSTEYTKTNWQDGDIITADKMNNIENGIKGIEDVTTTVKDGFDDLDDRVTALEQGSGSGLTEDIKQALLQIAEKVAYIDEDGQDYYDALESALYPPADLVSISAVYTQSGTVYTTDTLDSLKSDLVVTAHMSDSTTQTITAYTLSGTLTAGTSTITVSYSGKTTTFTVTVTSAPTLSSISAVYTQSGTVYDTDTLDSLKTDLVVTATYSDQTTETVTDYVLSGTLTVGTSTITVTYGGKTTTFTVTITKDNIIKVYKGKGVGGDLSIVDNPNRALSDIIDVTGATEIVTQWNYSQTQDAVRFTASDTTMSSDTCSLVPESYIGTSTAAGSYDAWRIATSNLVCATKSGTWKAKIPSSGKIRLLFRNVADPSTPIGTISGTITVNGDEYQLVEDTAEHFE